MADDRSALPRSIRALQAITRGVPRGWRRRIRRAMFEWLDLTWTTRSGVIVRLRSYPDWVVYNEVFVARDYDAAIDAAIARPPHDRPLRVLDLGANVGMFSSRVVDRLCAASPERALRLTAVEGNPLLAPGLRQTLDGLSAPNRSLSLLSGLAGRRSGRGQLYVSDTSVSDSIFPRPRTKPVGAPYVDLSPLLSEGVDLVKVDIEGAEAEMFENYRDLLPRIGTLVVEYHAEFIDPDPCRAILRDAGFREHLVFSTSVQSVWWYEREAIASATTPAI